MPSPDVNTRMVCHLKHVLFDPVTSHRDAARPWPGLAAHSRPGGIASRSLHALSWSFFGHSTRETAPTQRGGRLYGASLVALNEQLRSARGSPTNDVLLSVLILGMYEMLFLTAPGAWLKHGQGLATLIEMREPQTRSDPEFCDIFLATRFYLLLTSLATSQPTFLADPEWKAYQSRCSHGQKASIDALLDIVTDVPGLRSRSKHSALANASSIRLREESREIIAQLDAWYSGWTALPEAATSAEVPADHESQGIFGTVLTFVDLEAANCFAIYHTARILALESAKLATTHSEEAQHLHDEAHTSAVQICRSIPFHMSHGCDSLGQFFMLWPLRVAWSSLGHGTTMEGQWLQKQLRQLEELPWSWGVAAEALRQYP